MWSSIELRRYMIILFLIGSVLLCYMFWNQPTTTNRFEPNYESIVRPFLELRKPDFRWTWDCKQQRCVRRPANKKDAHVSLATCSMLCGSTQLWPQPTGPVTLGSHAITFNHEQFEFTTNAQQPANELFQLAFTIFQNNIISIVPRLNYTKQSIDIEKFHIKVKIKDSNEVRLKLATDESYKLNMRVDGTGILQTEIIAKNFFGARHGLETLAQLIWWDDFMHGGTLRIVKTASIQDQPKFKYRGLMIDTARNFMTIDSLRRVLIGMSANKLNVFHWHISDSQSFPLELPSVPKLAKYGAYNTNMVYTSEQVKDLVQFALVRGIRTIIEIDMPAHAGNGWQWGPEDGLGELAVCINMQPWMMYCGEPPCGQLNPENPHVYDIIEKIFKDILKITGEDEIYHLGGDEVNLACWAQMKPKDFTNYDSLHDVWGNFTLEATRRLKRSNKNVSRIIVWSSNLSKRPYVTKYLDAKEVVVQTWGGSNWNEAQELIALNYDVIISHVDAWYLDCGFGKWREQGSAACDPYRTWQTMYKHQPWYKDATYHKRVLGGEACLWSEQVDENALETRLWPRAAAVAERLWSDPDPAHGTYDGVDEDVYTRLTTQRERLKCRGLGAEALWPQWCSQNPGMCL